MQLGFLFTSPPYGSAIGRESLDLAMVGAAYDQEISLFFINQGLFQLVNDQQPKVILSKNHSKAFASLPFYDIEQIYVRDTDLKRFGLSIDKLISPVSNLDTKQFNAKLAQQDQIVTA